VTYCPDCGSELKNEDDICTVCERPPEKSKRKSHLYYVIGLVAVAVIVLVALFNFVPANEITLNNIELNLLVGDEEEVLSVTIDPIFARHTKLSWESSNPQVVEVNDEGKVKPLREGEAIVTVREENSDLKATCEVIVKFPTIYWDSGNYTGELKDDIPHGEGKWTNPFGDRYEGDWQEGNKHGHGFYTWENGDKYEGEWVDDKKHGHGVYTWANGDKYEGEVVDDKVHGQGVMTWANGDKYEGEWKDEKRHGQGTYTSQGGRIFTGKWEYGELIN